MFCTRCGAQVMDGVRFCPSCGTNMQMGQATGPVEADAPNAGYTILGVFVPLAGLILWAVNKDTKPLMAKSAGTGAIIGAILSVASTILFYIFYFVIMAAIYSFI